jgi:hypothetical protein
MHALRPLGLRDWRPGETDVTLALGPTTVFQVVVTIDSGWCQQGLKLLGNGMLPR